MTNLAALTYHVGIKRRFLPFYKKYRVGAHYNEQVIDKMRLILKVHDGSLVCVPDVGSRQIKVYPDFIAAEEAQRRLKANLGAQNANTVPLGE